MTGGPHKVGDGRVSLRAKLAAIRRRMLRQSDSARIELLSRDMTIRFPVLSKPL